jgi:hypothetical protein
MKFISVDRVFEELKTDFVFYWIITAAPLKLLKFNKTSVIKNIAVLTSARRTL